VFDWLINVVSGHPVTYLIVFAVAGADVLMPILPAETVVLAASIIAAHGGLQVWILIPAVALGGFCGDNVSFALGRRVGDPVARRLFRSEKAQRRLAWASRALRRRGGVVIVVGRFLPGGRTGGTFAAGTLEMPWHRFARADAIAATTWSVYVVLLGYFGGEAFRRSLWKPLVFALAVGLVLAGGAELYRRLHRGRGGGLRELGPAGGRG
jgi:membrane-associated protein